ncbi:kinase-like domain-containing protein [Aspergillus cavernicola]|uniref:Kinase-like domain-containing protein n=1 Tax=Aspergillus cavernicola TaxID=176166 RepID=A0ABR4IBN4_9EURO
MERINQICDVLSGRLERLRVRNHEERPFYPNGTARDVFRMDEENLDELFRALLWLGHLNTEVVPELVRRIVRNFSTILAVVLRIRPANDLNILQRFTNLIISDNSFYDPPRLTDENLPIPLNEAQFFFHPQGSEFFDAQFQFCAITLRREGHIAFQDDYRSQCPLPYKRQERIGGGAYGEVYRVKIERRHFRSHGDRTGNLEPEWLARKDFRSHQGFSDELEALNKIMRQPQKHDHVVMVLAILQYGDTNSLFFPLASCDLHQYLNGPNSPNHPAPVTVDQKSAIFNRGVALAGALAFLHVGFGETVCLHRDLKPRNVLVYNADNPEKEIWKITDFGLTVLRNPEHSITAPGGEGTYLPPECGPTRGRVTAQSDVWSLGCIFSLVITYMVYGSRGVRKFGEKRREASESDAFYITSKNSTPRISPAVTSWFDQLKQIVPSDERESRVIRESLDYLQSKALHPIRDQRASAKDVEVALKRIHDHFNRQAPPQSRSSSELAPAHQPLHARLISWLKQRPSKTTVSYMQSFQYDLGAPHVFGFRFSPPEGDFLAFFSAQPTLVWTVSEIMSALRNGSQIPQPQSLRATDGSIKCFAVSSNTICSCLGGDSFLCYVYNIEEPSSTPRADGGVKVSYDHMGFIKKVAMSSDGALSAFVITERPRGSESHCTVYLAYTQHLIDTADGGNNYPLPRSSRSNSVSDSSFMSVTTAANLIFEKARVGSASQIRFLNFTPDGKFLVIIIQDSSSGFCIRSWETYSGKCYSNFSVAIESSQTFRSLFTTCSLFVARSGDPCLAILADHRRIIYVNIYKGTHTDRILNINVDSMFVYDDGQSLLLIGKRRGLRVYLLPLHAFDRSDIITLARIDDLSYSPVLDDAAVRRDANQQLKLLIASSSGSFLDMAIPC